MHDFTLPIGPQIPSVKEPTCIRLDLKGNYVQKARIRLGYAHRGVEKLLEGKTIIQGLYAVERCCGICEFAHGGAYTRAIESMLKLKLPEHASYFRVLIAELERIHSHLLWTGFMSHEMGYETLFQFFMREREKVLDVFEKLTGGRVHHNINKIGTIRYGLDKGDKAFTLERIDEVAKKVPEYMAVFNSNKIIRARLKGIAPITKKQAKRYCLVGPVTRASGVRLDVRKSDPYLAYKDLKFKIVTDDAGDVLARTNVRLKEIPQSIKIVEQCLSALPENKRSPPEKSYNIAEGEAIGRVEAPRGENFHFIKVKNNTIQRARIRTPTYNNIVVLEELLIGREIGDIPVVVSSIDPCFACLERTMVVKNGKTRILDEQQFKEEYCD